MLGEQPATANKIQQHSKWLLFARSPSIRPGIGDIALYCSNVLGGTTSWRGGTVSDVPHPSHM
jgi:hypothetical protein